VRNGQLRRLGVVVLCALGEYVAASQTAVLNVVPHHALRAGTRALLDAHNAYVENGRWSDRLDRALATGLPIAIEQDLVWVPASSDAPGRSVVSHGPPVSGSEPTLEEYFFKRIAPLVEKALEENRRDLWPVFTLNLDFKTDEPEHHQAVWDVLGRYEKWLATAQRTAAGEIAPLRSAPLLVLTGGADAQEKSFHDKVPIRGTLRLFGAAHPRPGGLPGARTNYRRWANYPWSAVEPEGQPAAGQWTADDERRLHRLVDAAHAGELWIRFYTLNGHDPADTSVGWTPGYNFGTLDAVRTRWAAAVRAGVDFVATDQYEAFATARQSMPEF
jgi:glycerophosphoryl diester phosphodiesterase